MFSTHILKPLATARTDALRGPRPRIRRLGGV